jgi:putative membrane protein
MMWWREGGWGPGAWILMSLMMIVFWGGLIALTVWLVRTVGTDRSTAPIPSVPAPTTSTGKADEVLAERFARGEIDEDEFKSRRALLRSG